MSIPGWRKLATVLTASIKGSLFRLASFDKEVGTQMTAVSVRRITDESVVARKPSSTNSETVSLGTMGDGDSLRLRLSTTNPSRSYPATDRPARTAPSGRG